MKHMVYSTWGMITRSSLGGTPTSCRKGRNRVASPTHALGRYPQPHSFATDVTDVQMRTVWILVILLVSMPSAAAKFLCIGPDGSATKTSDPRGCSTMIALPEGTPAASMPTAPAITAPAPARPAPSRRIDNPACVKSESEVRRDIKVSLAQKYKGSYSLQETLYNAHMEAYRNICRMRVTPELIPSLERVHRRYYPHYSLMWTLIQSEQDAYRRLQ